MLTGVSNFKKKIPVEYETLLNLKMNLVLLLILGP